MGQVTQIYGNKEHKKFLVMCMVVLNVPCLFLQLWRLWFGACFNHVHISPTFPSCFEPCHVPHGVTWETQMSGRATFIRRLDWGWRIHLWNYSYGCEQSTELLTMWTAAHLMVAGFPQNEWSKTEAKVEYIEEATCLLWPSFGRAILPLLLCALWHRLTLVQCGRRLPKSMNTNR